MVTKEVNKILKKLPSYQTKALKIIAANSMIRPMIYERAKEILRKRLKVKRLHFG